LLVRERMPVDLEPGTGCIAKEDRGRGFNDDGQSREAIVLESRPSNLPVNHSLVSVHRGPSRPLNRAEPLVGRFKHNLHDSNWSWLSRRYRFGRATIGAVESLVI
jgi:hypothetical protein